MSQTIFIKKNLDTLLLSIDSLDPYIIDKFQFNLDDKSNIINLIELFTCKTSNCMTYTKLTHSPTFYQIVNIINTIIELCCSPEIQKNIYNILTENIEYRELHILTTRYNYFKKFQINYRKSFQPYLIGYSKYINNNHITKISLINLYILYKLSTPQGIYIILIYLMINI